MDKIYRHQCFKTALTIKIKLMILISMEMVHLTVMRTFSLVTILKQKQHIRLRKEKFNDFALTTKTQIGKKTN